MNKKKFIAYLFVVVMLVSAVAGIAPYVHSSGSNNVHISPDTDSASATGSITVGNSPSAIAYDSSNGYLYVPNAGSNDVSVISGTSVINTIDVGSDPCGIAYDPSNNYLYVSDRGSNKVSVISGYNNSVISTISVLTSPVGVAYDPSSQLVYVADSGDNYTSIIAGTGIYDSFGVGTCPWGVAYDPANKDMYFGHDSGSSVCVVPSSFIDSSVSVGCEPNSLAYDSANNYMYAAEYGGEAVAAISGTSVVHTISVGRQLQGIAYDSSNNYIYAADYCTASVSVISPSSNSVIGTVGVGSNPQAVLFDPANGYVYVVNSGSNTVSYFAPPSVSISASTNPVDAGQSVTFSASTSGGSGNNTFKWYVNGTAVSGAASSYTTSFSAAGTYKVYAVVTDGAGLSSTSNLVNESVNTDPSVSITASTNRTDAGVPVTFTEHISGGTPPYTQEWYVNNIAVSNASSYVFNESTLGSYNVSVIVKDTYGYIGDSNVIDEIVVATPTVSVTYSQSPIVSESVTISAQVHGGTGNISLAWTFNGGTATGRNVSYAFETAGDRKFSIAITDTYGNGTVYKTTQYFTVYVSLKITVSASPKTGNAPLTVDFDAEALGGTSYLWAWNFGNGNTSDSQSAENIFSAGNYTVTLTVTDSAGVTGNASVYIQAWPAPVTFVYSNNQNITYDFDFKALPNWDAKGPYNATWDMPNGQTLYGLNVSYYFPEYSKTNDITVDFTFSNTSIYQGNSYSQTIVVDMKPANISVKFSYPDPIPINTVLDLNVSATAPDTNSFTIDWNVSGTYGTGSSFTYDFSNPGTFYINISISDNLGASTHISKVITVQKVSSSSDISIRYTTTTNASIIGYNISVNSKYPIQSVQAYLDGALLPMNMTFSGGNATAGYIQYYTFSLNQRDYSTGDYQINIDVFTTNSQSNSTAVPFTVSSKFSNSAPFNIVAFFGGIYNMIYILLTIGGIIVTLVFTRPKPTDIDIDGTVLQAKPGKPVKELKRRK